jgi:hypothetical protein
VNVAVNHQFPYKVKTLWNEQEATMFSSKTLLCWSSCHNGGQPATTVNVTFVAVIDFTFRFT